MKKIKKLISESIDTKKALLEDEIFMATICEINQLLVTRFQAGKKLLLCGNGGSAADAQHIAAEFSGRFQLERKGLFAEALHVNSSALTAIANDYGFDHTYARMIEAKGIADDVLIAISTSGNSTNIINAIEQAKKQNMTIVGLTGSKQSRLSELCDYVIQVPSDNTARIQECHILIGHIICEIVELKLQGPKS